MMFFKIKPLSAQPLYLQVVDQIHHAVEMGALQDGDQLPGIRTLAQELVVSPNTIAKAYSELEHEGLLELRQGSGAFVSVSRRSRSLSSHIQAASRSVIDLVEHLRERDFRDEEIRRMFEAALLHQSETVRRR
jgi:GntR family transcriptional regulator